MAERDFIGYGPTPPKVEWPGGARIAVSVVVNYEEGSEESVLDGDPVGMSGGEGRPGQALPGKRDLASESFYEYGSRVGVWRIMDTLEEYNVPATFFVCAVALERNPKVAKEIVRRGHDILGHGYRWESYNNMERDQEREQIRKAVESIKRTTGQHPMGWYCRYAPSVNTRELVVEAGGFAYDSNAYNDDLPYYTMVKGKKWLVVPYSLDVNDSALWRGWAPNDFYETMRNAFDVLYQEGATHPKMMSIGLHCRIIGRPHRTWALRKFFEYAKGHPGVWFARRIEIARWWKEKYP